LELHPKISFNGTQLGELFLRINPNIFSSWGLEMLFPWRKNQAVFKTDFWLDVFYMFFNFFLLNLIVLIALSNTAVQLFTDFFRNCKYINC
jgi:hypothetical protein